MLDEGSFAKLPELIAGIQHCQKNNSVLHLLQLFGPGSTHAMDTHLQKIIHIIPSDIQVSLHLFGDGRDLGPTSMLELMQQFEIVLKKYPNVKISSIA